MRHRHILYRLTIVTIMSLPAMALYAADAPKELSGISIIGNKEAPKSLYIVPWKNSEVGIETSLNSGLLDEKFRQVDREVFGRELDYYELSHEK
jgi:hypothetical protein